MTRPRSELVSPNETPYYHCISRCVRRAYLSGIDHHSGQDYSHRKQWIVDRLSKLQTIFTIDLCAYAIMDNHYHLVVHIDTKSAQTLSEQQVAARWHQLFELPILVERYLANDIKSKAEQQVAKNDIAKWRGRLADLSWFMRCINQYISIKANAEDECTGRFWEGRFRSQAILDQAGLLACMAYVDLNPFRANIVTQPEQATFVSLQQRLLKTATKKSKKADKKLNLLPFLCQAKKDSQTILPFSRIDYLDLVDWVSRVQRGDKPTVSLTTASLLERLQMKNDLFLAAMKQRKISYGSVIGHNSAKMAYAQQHRRRCVVGASLTSPP